MFATRSRRMVWVAAVAAGVVLALFATTGPLAVSGAATGYLYIYTEERVWAPSERPEAIVRGKGATRVDLTVWRFDPEAHYAAHGSLESATRIAPGQQAELVRKSTEYPRPARKGADFTLKFAVPTDGLGGYVIRARDSQGREESTWILVTDLGIVAKQAQDELLVYAHDFGRDSPREGARIRVLAEGKQLASGETGSDGLWVLEAQSMPQGLAVVGTAGGSFALVNSSYYWEDARYKTYIYTDRPVYRPGQRVFFKGILREDRDGEFEVLAREPVRVEVRDSGDACVHKTETTTNDFGSFSGEFVLGDEPALGTYRVLATVRGSTHGGGFRVAEYRKPEYQVEVSTDKGTYVAGDDISVTVKATYYFGAPVPGARVRYSVYAQPYYASFYSREEPAYYPVEDESYGYYGELVASGEGATDNAGLASFEVETKRSGASQMYHIEAVVTDESRREVTGRASVLVARGLFEVSVQPEAYVLSPGERAVVRVSARTLDGKPFATGLEWQAMRVTWDKDKARRWQEAAGAIATGADGEALLEFTPREEGSYVVVVSGEDARGNRIASEGYLWVTSEGSRWSSYGGTEIEIVSDKDVYDIGDTAKILVNTTFDDVWALVTVEGRSIAHREVVRITGHTRLFELPVTREHMPNAFFTVTIVKGKRLYSADRALYVSTKENFLNVSIVPNKQTYQPGDRASYIIKTTDGAGRPVQAEVSLGIVDASIYAVQRDTTPDIKKAFYGSIWNRVVTNYSFPEWYYGGADKEGGSSEVRKDFPDTAFWAPAIVTDRSGTARVEFELPDSLTTWRATARAHSLKTQVGSATQDVVATKDLIVRLATPRFFTLGDSTVVTTVVHNYTSRQLDVKVSLEAKGMELTGADSGSRTVSVAPSGQASLDWKVACNEVGDARFVARAQAGRVRDALEVSVPVLPFGEPRTWHEAGQIEGSAGGGREARTLEFEMPANVVPGTVRAEIRLAPSVAATALGGLEYLASFPYGCVEQTMNSFLPNIVVARTLRDLGTSLPDLERDLPRMVAAGLARLYRYQHYDGGWGWWEYDDTDARMTAYVVYGLDLARRAGFDVDANVFARGKRALAELVAKPRDADDLVYKLYVLSEIGEKALPRLDEMLARRRELSDYSLALLTLTLANSGRAADARLALADLLASARGDGDRTYWDAATGERYWADNSVETTACALMALIAVDPNHARAPGIVRWLADARSGEAWFSTKDTAVAILALAEYVKARGEAAPDCSASVSVNGKQVGRARFTRKNAFDRETVIAIDPAILRAGENEISIETTGSGRVYYSASCEWYTAAAAVEPGGAGLTVARGYYRRRTSAAPGGTGPSGQPGLPGAQYTFEPVAGPLRPGDEVFVRIIIKAERPYRYVMVEDPLPSGFEAIDEPYDAYSWDFWYGRKEVRDDRVVFFSGYVKEGESEITYPIRAERPGTYRVMPARVWGMYSPEVSARSASSELVCEETVVASFSTTLEPSQRSRNRNIGLAAAAIDGTVLQPDEVFSFDAVVGPRLVSAGYAEARVISGGKSAPGIGGGVCQVSTTLYNVALLAGLEIVERHPHSHPVDYVPAGLDATVSEGQYDLKFRNSLGVPLTLEARLEQDRLVMCARAPLERPPEVVVATELRGIERPRLVAASGGQGERAAGGVYGGSSGTRVAVWRSVNAGGEMVRELVSEDRYEPIHAEASHVS